MRRKAALRSSGASGGARVVERIGSEFGSIFKDDFLEGVLVIEREEGCGRWLIAKAGVVGVETRLFRGDISEARWRLERRVERKAGACQRYDHLRGREGMNLCGDSLELDRKPGILSPKALTFSKSQSVKISISETLIVGNCSGGGVIMPCFSRQQH